MEGMFQIKKMGWKQLKELSNNGNEIAAHGYKHIRYGKRLPVDTLVKQMQKINKLIKNNIQKPVLTIHYPYSFTSKNIVKAVDKTDFYFGRTGGKIQYNTYEKFSPFLLSSRAILNDSTPNKKDFDTWLKDANGKWLILMYHHLFPENSKEMNIMNYHKVSHTYSLYPKTFDWQMKQVSQTNYWIATEQQVAKYITEYTNTKLKKSKFCHTYTIKTTTSLNSQVFNEPLTMEINIPWKKVKIIGSLNDGIKENKNGLYLINFLAGNTLKIKKK